MAGIHTQTGGINFSTEPDGASVLAELNKLPPDFPGGRSDKAYAEGRRAGDNGDSAGENPHTTGTPESLAWLNGWLSGAFSDTGYSGLQLQTAVIDKGGVPFGTGQISEAAVLQGGIYLNNGVYTASQYATSGSGSGAEFTVTIAFHVVQSVDVILDGGLGYFPGDTIALDIPGAGVFPGWDSVVLVVSALS